jgi:hypothetical protein
VDSFRKRRAVAGRREDRARAFSDWIAGIAAWLAKLGDRLNELLARA